MLKKRNIKRAIAICCIPAAAIITTSCSLLSSQSGEDIVISDETIIVNLKDSLNSSDLQADEITSFSKEESELTEDESESLSERLTSKTVVKKYICTFTASCLDRNINGKYEIVYAYLNKEWSLIKAEKYDEESWTYSAKDVVSVNQIRTDLTTMEFPNLDGSVIGNESDTELEITERTSDIENGNDNVGLTVTYNATFAIYKIKVKMQYKFLNGEWVLSAYTIDEQEFWEIEFIDGQKPQEPKEEYIVNTLSNSSDYINYMMNLSYVDNYYVTKGSETINGNTVNYNYVLIVTYNEFGDIEYNVTKPYKWVNKSWEEQELEVSVKEADWSDMLGTWASTNGDFIRYTSLNDGTLTGTYTHKYDDGNYVTYNITSTITIELTDNNWSLNIDQGDIVAGEEEEHFVILPFRLNFKDDTIICNGNIYIAKGDEDGGPGFILNSDGSYYIEEDDDDDSDEDDSKDDYSSGLDFFDDNEYVKEETTSAEE